MSDDKKDSLEMAEDKLEEELNRVVLDQTISLERSG
jgi:hypothetical protein